MTTDKVVDASALAAAAFIEPRAQAVLERLRGQKLIAPPILRFEMASVCLKKIRSRPSERELILQQFEDSLAMPIQEYPVDHNAVVQTAEKFGISTYDANYLWLAQHLKIELVTLDGGLKKAAAKI